MARESASSPTPAQSDARAALTAAALAAVAETAASASRDTRTRVRTRAPVSAPAAAPPLPHVSAAPAPPPARSQRRDSPDTDLARNLPGAAVAAKAAEEALPLPLELGARLLGIRTRATPWRVGAAGERKVGRKLRHLESHGWKVLHAIQLSGGGDIDHLVIGPAGVFTINTKHHAGARIKIGTYVVWVNGSQYPYVRNSLREARTVQRVLSNAVGFAVPVTPVLAFVRPGSLTIGSPEPDVLIAQGHTVHRTLRPPFRRTPVLLEPEDREAIYEAARRSRTWLK